MKGIYKMKNIWLFIIGILLIIFGSNHVIRLIGLAVICAGIFACIFDSILYSLNIKDEKKYYAYLSRYKELTLGMSESELVDIMGNNYSKSLLQGGFSVYRFGNENAYIDVSVKDSKIYEVRPTNI